METSSNTHSIPILFISNFGFYHFDGITAGASYIVSVSSKKHTFTNPTRVLEVLQNVTDADFVAKIR